MRRSPAPVEGKVLLDGLDVYGSDVDVTAVRRAIGMVFQKPNPFPTMSIFRQRRGRTQARRHQGCRRQRARRMGAPGRWPVGRSQGPPRRTRHRPLRGQQQRLCIARTIAVEPELILMDEPCSALDPIATLRVEELIHELKSQFTIVIVTHNMQQAARVADRTAFFLLGDLVEVGQNRSDLHQPDRQSHGAVRLRQVRQIIRARLSGRKAVTGMDPSKPIEIHHGAQLRVSFLEELNGLEASALGGLDAVVEDLDRVIAALTAHDALAAGLVVTDAERLAQRCTDINNNIVVLLARQAPVASDLRLAAGLLHLVKHLERMGDQCVNIAKMVPLMGTEPPEESAVASRIAEMGRIVRSEVVQARQAFELRDSTLALSIREIDQRVNVLNKEIFRLSIDLGDDADVREWLFTMAMCPAR